MHNEQRNTYARIATATILVGLAIGLTAAPTASAVCVGQTPQTWWDRPGGFCADASPWFFPPYVCVTNYPADNCMP